MHRLVPVFVLEKYANDQTTGMFDACAIFVDVSGFTAITDVLMGHGQHGAEVLANIIHEVFDPLIRSVFEQGGFVTNLAGDAFTAVFPSDNRSPDSFTRALAAAWQIQQVMATSKQHQTPYGTFDLSVKVGLAAGRVAWGIISSGDRSRATYYFRGTAIEGAVNAQKQASAGEVIIDENVLRVLGPMVSVVPIEEKYRITAVKGVLPTPQPVNYKAADSDNLMRFFPPEASRPDLSGEFRQVASMFVRLPAVKSAEQLERFMQIIFELQDRYGGLINRLEFGDKGANLLLFWGAPVAHENDVVSALNFILDLQSQTVTPINAGITYGIAHGGYSGGELAGEYTCHGRGTSLAARLMQASPRGEIWMDENIAERVGQRFEMKFVGEMAFKGFTEEQRVFLLLRRKEKIELLYERNMVGRQEAKGNLVDFVQPIWQGEYPGIMVIWGEPGIGKSRLVHTFLSDLAGDADREVSVFICQSDEIFRESLNPFRYWLRRYFEQSEQRSDRLNKRNFDRKLDHLIANAHDGAVIRELERTRSFLGGLVRLYWPDSLYEQLDAKGRYENSFAGLLTLLQAESLQRPVILVLEDIHWLDEDSKAFLQQLTRGLTQAQAYPIAVLATARLEGDRRIFGDEIAFREINLHQLSRTDQARLASDQLGSPIGSDLLELLVERAEGNPFFAEQLLRYLQEQKMLQLKRGVWHLKAKQETTLPTDVSAVLVARLDRLTQHVKEVVQTASVLGREFEIQLLSRMLHDDPAVRENVVQAEEMSIWSALSELRYIFNHALLRDAAYRMQIRARRQSLHKAAVEALETIYKEDLGPHYGELAYHAEQAKLADKARRYLEMAGDTAREAFQNSMALDYYGRALSLTPEEELESRFQILSSRERLFGLLGLRQEQLQDLNAMSELAEQLKDAAKQATVLVQRAWHFWWNADYPAALVASQRATDLVEKTGQTGLTEQINFVSMWVSIQQGQHAEARRFGEKALVDARQAGNYRLQARIFNALGEIHRVDGDYFSALQRGEEALYTIRSLGDRQREGISLGNLGVLYMALGDYEAARDCFKQAMAIQREVGSRVGFGSILINLCWNAQILGELESAIQYGEEGIAIHRQTKRIEGEAEAHVWLGNAWLGSGKLEKAFVAYRASLKIRRKLAQEHLAMEVLAAMGRAAMAQNDPDSAAKYVAEILSFLDAGGSLDGTWEPLRIYFTCYQVLLAVKDARAGEFLGIAYQELQKRAAKIPDMGIRHMFLENVPWNRDITAAYRKMGTRD